MATALVAAALSFAGPAAAHRGHAGLTVVEIDPASGAVAVTHRFYAHDIEPTLTVLAPDEQPSLDDPEALAALNAHLAERFRIDIDGARVSLHRTGETLAGDNVRIDFAGERAPGPVTEVRVDQDFFSDIYDDMEMQVNVRVGGVTRTVLFRPGIQAQSVRFDR
ncbi:DUF6702 family protein [Brevundimonas sp.]|uniref:DUF6702 family protein n=1 Tax=Brevundimonas sp. TaxID=1871086 RepID=UPI001A32AA51|nr:DUF6702 family protein [Brevundimonas sp.]MBJ7483856.1 hypothetical protein [Brevundimonas sp.]